MHVAQDCLHLLRGEGTIICDLLVIVIFQGLEEMLFRVLGHHITKEWRPVHIPLLGALPQEPTHADANAPSVGPDKLAIDTDNPLPSTPPNKIHRLVHSFRYIRLIQILKFRIRIALIRHIVVVICGILAEADGLAVLAC